MKKWIQGMIAAALVCEAAFFMSCSSKDSEKNIADKVIGKWINVGEEQENREWWDIESIENGVMKWKALRIGDDGASFFASFSMTKVTEP